MGKDEQKYLELLAKEYPTRQQVCREIINLNAIRNLPKGTEHFMSDLHGEYESFCHIINNCAGVIKEKIERIFATQLSEQDRQEICTLIYYPREKLNKLWEQEMLVRDWYKVNLQNLITIAKDLSSKYTRSKVRKAMPEEFAYIIDELLHMQVDEDNNQIEYHRQIIETIINIQIADEFIIALAELIKRLAVDHLHIVGDIYDRGAHPDCLPIRDPARGQLSGPDGQPVAFQPAAAPQIFQNPHHTVHILYSGDIGHGDGSAMKQ